jgi:pyrophosphatase PpaX
MHRLALLFDLDGTLIDSIGLLIDCMEHAFAGATRYPTRDQWVAGIGTPLRTQLAEWADDDAMVETLLSRYRDFQDIHLERLTSAYPGIVETLAWARGRGHAVGLVTSKGRGMTDRSLRHVGLSSAFDIVVTVESTTRHKPHPEPVLFALAALDMSAECALFVGDSPHDVVAGRTASVLTAACMWGPFSKAQLEPARPDFWLHSVPGIRQLVEHLERSNLGDVPPVKTRDLDGNHVRRNGDDSTT